MNSGALPGPDLLRVIPGVLCRGLEGLEGLEQELGVQCRALLGLNIAYARLWRLSLPKKMSLCCLFMSATLGLVKFGVVHKV